MDQIINFSDILKKSVLKALPGSISLVDLIVSLVLALVIGICIFLVYRKTFIGAVYDHSFSISLVIMTLLVAIIIVTISSNITLSLGMVGALSIVRYRTAVKSPLDLIYMFWAITTGIAVGAGYYYIAVVGFFVISLAFIILGRIKDNGKTYILIINYDKAIDNDGEIMKVLGKYRKKIKSKTTNKGFVELTIEVNFDVENMSITSKIMAIEGVNDVSLVQYRNSYEL